MAMSKPTQAEVDHACNEMGRVYLSSLLQVLALTGLEELNFVKNSFTTPGGGLYLLQVQHVSGPKINLKELLPNEQAPAQESP
jgi:hypothetical protein